MTFARRPRPAVPAECAGDAHTSHTAYQVADLQTKEAPERQTALENATIVISSEYESPLVRSEARVAHLPCMHAWPQGCDACRGLSRLCCRSDESSASSTQGNMDDDEDSPGSPLVDSDESPPARSLSPSATGEKVRRDIAQQTGRRWHVFVYCIYKYTHARPSSSCVFIYV